MKRESVNPNEWGLAFKMDQGEIIEGATRTLHFSGQCALKQDAESPLGVSVTNADSLRAQMQDSLDNIDSILQKAGMTRKNLVHLRFFTTEIDGFLENYDVYAEWIDSAGTRPPQSLIGVDRLVFPELKVEIEATASV